jgi:hypothetical protein
MITQSKLKQLLHYDLNTGQFTRLVSTSIRVKVGYIAGYVRPDGYRVICIDYKLYRAHRLAWLYIYGKMPKELDHINGVRDDNRIGNLRECTRGENLQNRKSHKNSSSKYLGVSWHKSAKKWLAQIQINDKKKRLGLFTTQEDAFFAYCDAKKQLHTFNPEVRYIQTPKD